MHELNLNPKIEIRSRVQILNSSVGYQSWPSTPPGYQGISMEID